MSRLLAAAGAPERVAAALEDGVFKETEAIRVARAWRATRSGVLVFTGQFGCGKSVAAAWLLANNVTKGRTVADPFSEAAIEIDVPGSGRWVSASELVEASDFDGEFRGRLRKVDLLVIDEAGAERLDAKGRALDNFTDLLRRRYDDAKRTVITTNYPPSEWLKLYTASDGGRLRDRMAEAEKEFGQPVVVALTGKSLRGGAAR